MIPRRKPGTYTSTLSTVKTPASGGQVGNTGHSRPTTTLGGHPGGTTQLKSPTSPTHKSTNGTDLTRGKSAENGQERQPVKKSDSFMNSRNVFQSLSNGKQTRQVQKSESFSETRRKSSSSSSSSVKVDSVAQRRHSSTKTDVQSAHNSARVDGTVPKRPNSRSGTISDSRSSSLSDTTTGPKQLGTVSDSVSGQRHPSGTETLTSSSQSGVIQQPPHAGGVRGSTQRPPHTGGVSGSTQQPPHTGGVSGSTQQPPHTGGVSGSTQQPPQTISCHAVNGAVSLGTAKVKGGSPHKFTAPEQSGYVGFANLPNQVHRKSVKKGFEFTLMVVGESGLGKSTLVNSLFLTDLYPERHIHSAAEKISQTVKIDASTVEIEERGVKLRLTVVDTPGFGDSLNSQDCFKPIIQYIDSQFERYLEDESGLNRRHIVDNRVHCCFYFINPSGHGLRPLDISFMKAVHHKVNIVPVIAKADTLTQQECKQLKRKVMTQIMENGINLYALPDCDEDEDEEYREQCRLLKEAVPFAVIGANTVIEVKGKKVRGRMYPWGVVEVENPDHCDFIKLRTMLITHMQDLQEVTQEVHYENFRAEKLADGGSVPKKTRRPRNEETYNEMIEPENPQTDLSEREKQLVEKEQELRRMQEMIAKMQAEMNQRNTPQKTHQNGEVKSQNV
ncbi:septin-2-like isoform X2 [Ostrea edulis]|uniref:septin-2-like isoform X2 n=1 Tax=Ostrea edulis TaxID=37623 RepID=UPI0024AE9059|nr:septin-2-like isoform X2 [Ostrea edulis]